jgi:two-component system, NarL family, response regulator LiaR
MTNKIRVMIVDDHLVVRKGFAMFIKSDEGLVLVGEATNGKEAVELCKQVKPDVILMDVMMPEMTGIEATHIIRSQHPNTQIICLTSFNDDNSLVQKALEAGALGYLFKDISIEDLSHAIRSAYAGIPILAPEATRMLISAKTKRSAEDFKLSERELEVMRLLVDGMSNPRIAQELTISRSTVKFHVSSILGKLGASSRTEAVSLALQHDLI